MPTFEIEGDDFVLDGSPFRVIAGAIHYQRVHPELWRDRIRKARRMGLNTIETYIPWNAHAPRRGTFDVTGQLDLGRFLDIIAEEGMYALVRPGPYTCAEWHNGGLPAWLFTGSGVGVRALEPQFMAAVREYYGQFGPILAARQIDTGGPIILVQVENEYGAYGSDPEYLRAIEALTREVGITVPLTTVDQPTDEMLAAGGLPSLLRTGSFGSHPRERLATLRRHQPTGPLMCSEFWDGWFDGWGEIHHATSASQAAADLAELLELGASVNVYMFHGGTNFGLTNGANDKGTYRSIITSYDYDAPLDEAGNETEKYWEFQRVLAPYSGIPLTEPRPVVEPAPVATATLDRTVALWDALDLLGTESLHRSAPTFEAVGTDFTFGLYGADVPGGVLEFDEVRDRAQLFSDRGAVAVLSRELHERRAVVPAGRLEVLLEDLGRVNYGKRIGEPKGLVGPGSVDGSPVEGWTFRPLDFARLEEVASRATPAVGGVIPGPVFAVSTFETEHHDRDHFLDTDGWTKGVAWINGFCLGRYWSRGPQRTLYVPAPVLRAGSNELVILELHSASPDVSFVATPDLGPTEA